VSSHPAQRISKEISMASHELELSAAGSPPVRAGMGTMLIPGGVAFRVWAPFAAAVFAAGEFNQWSLGAHPFTREAGGGPMDRMPFQASVGIGPYSVLILSQDPS
jgi:hypothetical protein